MWCFLGFGFDFTSGIFETSSHSVAQADLELTILLSQPPKRWDYRCVPPCPAMCGILNDIFFFFLSRTQGLTITRQALYHLSHSTSSTEFLMRKHITEKEKCKNSMNNVLS
jgi:hypothetical protein